MGRSQIGQIRVKCTERVMSHVPPTGFATRLLAMIHVRILTSVVVFCEASSDRLLIICGQSACSGTVAKNGVMIQLDALEIGVSLRSWSRRSDKTTRALSHRGLIVPSRRFN